MALAVRPAILNDALAEVLAAAGVDEIVPDPHTADVAVVTSAMEDDIDTPVYIVLPDEWGSAGRGELVVAGDHRSVTIDGVGDLVDLLDDHCPGPASRRQQLGLL